ncbi:CDI toxin immunity protein [Aquimarina macrocephali]|uniref:CDI toxin immunity protein n=1 Tax=Aquimarina macrocephali TaxID=666563 RepID=UPI0004674AD6|nr:hypothetical protein [Aquimarina macrocephali]
MSLLQECIDALDSDIEVFIDKESEELFEEFEKLVKFNQYGRIDWEQYSDKVSIVSDEQLNNLFESEYCYIFWNEMSLPVIKTKLELFLKNLDDVLAVSFDTWILSGSKNIVVEYFHDDKITLTPLPDGASMS